MFNGTKYRTGEQVNHSRCRGPGLFHAGAVNHGELGEQAEGGAGLGPARGVGRAGPLYTQSSPGSESALGFPRQKPRHTHSFQGPGGDLPVAPTPDPKHTVWDLTSCLPQSVSNTGLLASSSYTCCSLWLGCCSPRGSPPDLPFSRGLP